MAIPFCLGRMVLNVIARVAELCPADARVRNANRPAEKLFLNASLNRRNVTGFPAFPM